MIKTVRCFYVATVLCIAGAGAAERTVARTRPDPGPVPGVVINHLRPEARDYVGSPSIAILANGRYVASHDIFGDGPKGKWTYVFESTDSGRTWKPLAEIQGQYWSTLFVHQGNLYLIGASRKHGNIVIRRSTDGGRTWTNPTDKLTGLLAEGRFHCAPVPVVVHNGRIWRGFEVDGGAKGWETFVISAPVNADLLKADSWRMSNKLLNDPKTGIRKWLEGNVVVGPDGQLVNILRTQPVPARAAMVHVSPDGTQLNFDPGRDIINFPGGPTKFSIRYDKATRKYWSLANIITDPGPLEEQCTDHRNTLALVSSSDLKNCDTRYVALSFMKGEHLTKENNKFGFQYVDWLFEGNDIVFVSRTAWSWSTPRSHDANYLTFHRIKDFRRKQLTDKLLNEPGSDGSGGGSMANAKSGKDALQSSPKEFVNTLGMKFVRIEPGTFQMGQIKTPLPFEILPVTGGRGDRMDSLMNGDYDEKPVHTVKISKPFYMGVVEVANAQYELFDPAHKNLRGRNKLSGGDDEAVNWVSWHDAQAFCQWLSDKEGLPYRLPTEAEWEYTCRAGTTTAYQPGDVLPKGFLKKDRSLKIGATPPNPWGLFDMHGNVEEWCLDWYGPYQGGSQTDPVGYADGECRVSRGGSIEADVYSLRSANRLSALPETRNWLMGFRVVLGELLKTKPLPVPPPPLHQRNVVQRDRKLISQGPPTDKPYFKGPRKFVKIPTDQFGPIYAYHNHGPGIVECPNGDLLAVWFSCDSERNREVSQAASRLRWGAKEWEDASLFFDAADRNDPTPTLWFDDKDKLYCFIGISPGDDYKHLAVALRTSTDSGATWSKARLVMPDYPPSHDPQAAGHQTSEPVFRLQGGSIGLAADGGQSLWISHNEGLTWTNPGGRLPGTHPGITQLKDGRLLGFSRGVETEGMMTKGISTDLGKTYSYSASEFPGIEGGQRLVLLRLREGPLFFASFADKGVTITDASGNQREVRGLFTAVSTDEGQTWPYCGSQCCRTPVPIHVGQCSGAVGQWSERSDALEE